MSLLVIGINHKTAPVAIREKVAFTSERIEHALRQLSEHYAIREVAILSTCNRAEIYLEIDKLIIAELVEWLASFHLLSSNEIAPYIYSYANHSAVKHIMCVASGLDSMILGEPQILGQIKLAYNIARKLGTINNLLDRLFQNVFAVAKQVRTDTAIGSSPVSVAFAAVSLARQIFSSLTERTALLIGAGETIELTARHLRQNNISRIIIANRTIERAHLLAAEIGGYAIALTEINEHLAEVDIIISATGSTTPILSKNAVEIAIKKRRHRPIFMVDIAVPRDIEPQVEELADVYLYTVDDLHEVIQENLHSRQEAAKQAEEIINIQVNNFMEWMNSLSAVATICAYRAQGELLRDSELNKAQRLLTAGKDPAEVLTLLARGLTNKLLHQPCTRLRQAAGEGRPEILTLARELFNLDQ